VSQLCPQKHFLWWNSSAADTGRGQQDGMHCTSRHTWVMLALVCALKVSTIDVNASCGSPVCRCLLTQLVLPVPLGPTSRQWWWWRTRESSR
jgi:hypothetical protein